MQACGGAQGKRPTGFLHFGLFSSNDMASTSCRFARPSATGGMQDSTSRSAALPEEMGKRNLLATLLDSSQGAARQIQHRSRELLLGNVPAVPQRGPQPPWASTVSAHT